MALSPAKFLRAMADKKITKEEATTEFRNRLRVAFHIPKESLQEDLPGIRRLSLEASSRQLILQAQLRRLHKQNILAERKRLSDALKSSGMKAESFANLAMKAGGNIRTFVRMTRTNVNRFKTLQDVVPQSPFLILLSALRDLYAEDIAQYISFDDSITIVVEEILLHS